MYYGNSTNSTDSPSNRIRQYVHPLHALKSNFKHLIIGCFKNGFVWSNIQLGTSIVSACLPIYRPLLSKCVSIHASISSSCRSLLSNSQLSKNSRVGGPSRDGQHGLGRPRYTHFGGPHDDQSRLTKVTGGPVKGEPVRVNANLPLHSISVRSSIEIV